LLEAERPQRSPTRIIGTGRAGRIAARSRQARDEAAADRVADTYEYDRDRLISAMTRSDKPAV